MSEANSGTTVSTVLAVNILSLRTKGSMWTTHFVHENVVAVGR